MCGFAGFLIDENGTLTASTAIVSRMALAIQHRGPDDAGAWADEQAGIALGHRRLSIVHLHRGHQPMASAGGRFVIAFNGEIYNHLELRAELCSTAAAPAWRGHSDTETLLAAFERWGIEATLQKTVGMFAIALWDVRERTLHLARDRFGEKPLYYGWVNGAFVFGSELKALRAYPGFANPVSREALACTCVLPMCRRRTASTRGFTSSNRAVCSVSAVNPKNGRFSAAAPAGKLAGHHAAALVVFGGRGGGRGEKSDS